MSDWRNAFGLKAPEAPKTTDTARGKDDYKRLCGLANQLGLTNSWVQEKLAAKGVELAPFTLKGFTTEIFDFVNVAIKTERQWQEAKGMGPDALEFLRGIANGAGMNEHLSKRLAEMNVSEDGTGLNQYIVNFMEWEIRNLPKLGSKTEAEPPSLESGTTAPTSTETPLGSGDDLQELTEVVGEVVGKILESEAQTEEDPKPSSSIATPEANASAQTPRGDEQDTQEHRTGDGAPSSEPKQLPATIEQVNNGRQIVSADGEVLNPGAYFEMLGIDNVGDNFRIQTIEDVKWFVRRIRAAHHEIEDIGWQAMSRIREIVTGITGLMFHYGLAVRQISEPDWKRVKNSKDPARIGTISGPKHVKLDTGTIFFEKTGGLKLKEGHRWRSFIEQVVNEVREGIRPQSDMNKYCIKITVGYDYHKMRGRLNAMSPEEVAAYPGWEKEPELETGLMRIGGPDHEGKQKKWSFASIKKALGERLKGISLKGEENDNTDEDTE